MTSISRVTLSGEVDIKLLTSALIDLWALPGHRWRTLMIYEANAEILATGDDVRTLARDFWTASAPLRGPWAETLFAPDHALARTLKSERRSELRKHAQVEPGGFTTDVPECASSAGDGTAAGVLDALQLELPVGEEVELLGHYDDVA